MNELESKNVTMTGRSGDTDTATLNKIWFDDSKKHHPTPISWSDFQYYEDVAEFIKKKESRLHKSPDLIIVGLYVQSKNQDGKMYDAALKDGKTYEAVLKVCRRNSRKLVKLCQQRHQSYLLVDTGENPAWPEDLKKLLAELSA